MNTLKLKPTTAAKLASFKTLDALLRTSEGRLRVRFGLSGAEIKELKKALEKQGRMMSKRPYQVRNPRGRHPVEKKQLQLWVYLPEEIVAKMGLKPQRFIKELVLAHFDTALGKESLSATLITQMEKLGVNIECVPSGWFVTRYAEGSGKPIVVFNESLEFAIREVVEKA